MIRLKVQRGAEWVDLGHGVRVEVMPVTAAVMARAMRSVDLPDSDPGWIAEIATAIARDVVIGWEGVGSESGEPIEPDPAGVTALISMPLFSAAFTSKVVAPAFDIIDEGNGSRPLRSGISEADSTTATDAGSGARSAPQ